MKNQQLFDYIKQQLQQGVNNEDIKKVLFANNWQSADIEGAFNSITALNQQNQSSNNPQSSKSKVIFIIIAIICMLVIGGGVIGYFVWVRNFPTPVVTQNQISSQPTQEQTTPKPTEKTEVTMNGWTKYIDPQDRFSFFYPPEFGMLSQGTNSGFGNRVAAIKFSEFSWGLREGKIILGGEATLTKGFVLVDIQALGGLYDSITLGLFDEEEVNNILENIPTLTAENFCGELAKASHIDLSKSAFSSLSQEVRDVIADVDQTRNIDPEVISCDVSEDTVTFHKEATFESGQVKTRQNIYGAIQFLKSPFSSFQIIRATAEVPTHEMLNNITLVVKSFK